VGGEKIEAFQTGNVKWKPVLDILKPLGPKNERSFRKWRRFKLLKKEMEIAWGALYWQYFEDWTKLRTAGLHL